MALRRVRLEHSEAPEVREPLNGAGGRDAQTTEDKGDQNAAGWLPDDDDDQCALVVRQISIKQRWKLSVTPDELQAMDSVLHSPVCNGARISPLKAKEFRAPKPKPNGEPKPKPKPKPKADFEARTGA